MGPTNIAFQRTDYPLNYIYDPSSSVAAGDLNGDGFNDLVVSSAGELVMLNDHGKFSNVLSLPQNFASGGGLAVGDLNNDGKPDIVGADSIDASSTFAFLNGGNGTAFNFVDGLNTGLINTGLTLSNINNDGKLDLIDTTIYGVNAAVGNGDGTFSFTYVITCGNFCGSSAVGDFDRDGNIDLALVTSKLLIFFGNGDGTFKTPVAYNLGPFPPGEIAVGDLNGDGSPDIVVRNYCAAQTCVNGTTGSVSLFLNNGTALSAFRRLSTSTFRITKTRPFLSV